MFRHVSVAVLLCLLCALGAASLVAAEPVSVQYREGVTRGFPALRSATGELLARGDLSQVARGDRVESRITFRFLDGSLYDETVVFDQAAVFTLVRYHVVQRGPAFPEQLEASLDRHSERYHVRYRADEDSAEEVLTGSFSLPPDAYNGLLTTLLKNLPAGGAQMVQIVAFTPRPRLVSMRLAPLGTEVVPAGASTVEATRYSIKPQLGLLAALLVVDSPDLTCWIARGEVPGFVRFEGPLYFQGPLWRIE